MLYLLQKQLSIRFFWNNHGLRNGYQGEIMTIYRPNGSDAAIIITMSDINVHAALMAMVSVRGRANAS